MRLLPRKPLAREPFVRFDVLFARANNHIVGQCRRRAVFVPGGRFQPVADELLVERRLALARTVLIGRPEARAVGREHFVDQDQLAVDLAPFELCVGDDDPALAGNSAPRW